MSETPLLAIVGPTAVGKSRLALHLAQALGGEIVNADSRQVYRRMDIGTAKPSAEERRMVPHHLLDIRSPDEEFSLAFFLDLANKSVADIHRRGRLPVIVGGTGQYVRALLEGWRVPKVPPNSALRADLELQAQQRGAWALYQLLQAVDPKAAKRIAPNNTRRIIRALEIRLALGARPSQRRAKKLRRESIFTIGLTTNRKELYRRIDARVDLMIARGFVEEVRALLDLGYDQELPAMSSIGYQEIALHLRGKLTLEEAVQRTKYHTHRIARHQYAWFRLEDPNIHWMEADGTELEAGLKMAREFATRCDKMASSGRADVNEIH